MTLVVGCGHLAQYLLSHNEWQQHRETITPDNVPDAVRHADCIINCAAKTNLEWCEANARQAWRDNVELPLAMFRAQLGGVFVHIGSGCIWPTRAEPYSEDDPPNPPSYYGWTKAAADAILLLEASKCTQRKQLFILRPRQVFSPMKLERNTLVKLMTYPRLIDEPNSMTSAAQIMWAIHAILYGNVAVAPRIYNIASRGSISPYRVGMALYKRGLRSKPELMARKELDAIQNPKRVSVVMDVSRMCDGLFTPATIEEELARTIHAYEMTRP
jgi:dTDP-4-dehydrorhamnose reductase